MKVLYFYQYFTTPRGAWSTRVYEMARRWADSGDAVTVVTSVYDKSDLEPDGLITRRHIEGIDVIALNIRLSNKHGVLARLATFLGYATLASWYALRTPADVVVASSGPITAWIPGLVSRLVRRRPLVLEVRDLWPEGAIQLGVLRNATAIRLAQAFERFAYTRASAVVACSPGQAEGVRAVNPTVPVTVVSNASDLELMDRVPALDPLPEWAEGRHIVVYTGTIGQANDCWQIVEAAQTLQDAGRDDIRIVMIGDGKDREAIERDVADRELTTLRVLGLRPKPEVVGWLHHALASLLVFRPVPVLDTNSPNKLFDALAAGVPVVQTTRGWIKTLLEERGCGVTVPPGDGQAMAHALITLADDEGRRYQMGRAARTAAEDLFSRDDLARSMRAALRGAVRSERATLTEGAS